MSEPESIRVPGALAAYCWSARVAALVASVDVPDDEPVVPARVLRVDRDRCLVVTPTGEAVATGHPLPAAGDWLVVAEAEAEARIVGAVPAWSTLVRHGAAGTTEGQVMAANVDIVFVVVGLDRPLNPNRLDRELVVTWESGARPVVVLAKADAHPDPETAAAEVAERAVGVDVLVTSSVDGYGLAELRARVGPTDTVVLLGASGVGKSSLVNRLLGEERQDVGATRASDHKGRHTTTARHLFPLPGGGVLIDTPGLRSLGLWEADDGLSLAFADIAELALDCRFRDCAHDQEPGCAVRAAIEDGTLSADRFASFGKLQREAARVEVMRDARSRAEHAKASKAFFRAVRRLPNRP